MNVGGLRKGWEEEVAAGGGGAGDVERMNESWIVGERKRGWER